MLLILGMIGLIGVTNYQKDYCACKRAEFKPAYCESFKLQAHDSCFK